MQTKEEYLEFMEDLKKTSEWIGDNIENVENATILITWLLKCAKKLEDNLDALIKLQEENEPHNSSSEEK